MGKFNRDSRRGNRRDFGDRDRNRGPRQMFQATCSECGNDCEIPFKAREGRPVFCSSCFEGQKKSGFNSSENRGGNRSSFGNKRLFEAVCDSCGKKCEVPFQPSGEKPVYCNQCFGKGDNAKVKQSDQYQEQFIKLNAKLDKILDILIPKTEKVRKEKDKPAKTKKISKKTKNKKK